MKKNDTQTVKGYLVEYSEDWGFGEPPECGTFKRVCTSRERAMEYLSECVEDGVKRMGEESCEGTAAVRVVNWRAPASKRIYVEGGAEFIYKLRECEIAIG